MNQQEQLEQLAAKIIKNNVCAELAAEATQLVIGEGNPNADIIIIGEAPGKEEDKQGRPFVGASGKFLDQMLESIGLSRKDIYITNIVKYRPPGNRDPSPEEKRAFRPYLDQQIQIIQPKVIVTLGRHSMNEFLPDAKISQDHGIPQRVKNQVPIFPLYHPAAALYNGGMRQTLLDDFQKLKEFLESGDTDQNTQKSDLFVLEG